MLKIRYNNTTDVYIRPVPLISISSQPLKNKIGSLGSDYTITLNGTIISHDGSPFFLNSSGSGIENKFSTLPIHPVSGVFGEDPKISERLESILFKQNILRELFSRDGQRMEITSLDNVKNAIIFYPTLVSINFEEGIYLDTCRYSIELSAPILFKNKDEQDEVMIDSMVGTTFATNKFNKERTKEYYLREDNDSKTIEQIIQSWGGFVEDFKDDWSIEIDENFGQTINIDILPRTYRITRNMSAIGRSIYHNGIKYEAWEQAAGFIKKTILEEPEASPTGNGFWGRKQLDDNIRYEMYPSYKSSNLYGNGFLNLPSFYKGFNHIRTMSIDKSEGSCNVSDSWILASGDTALENYSMSIESSSDNINISVKINGTIKGLSQIPASGYSNSGVPLPYNKNLDIAFHTPYLQATKKYFDISNSGHFGLGSPIFNRANNLYRSFNPSLDLNSQPLSVSLSTNEAFGEISYNIEFNNRPTNYFTGVLAENISVNDTYPGDTYAIIPVLGRKAGPVLQYIKSRTGYKRDISIDVILDYTELYGSGYYNTIEIMRERQLLNKPSLNNSITNDSRSQKFKKELVKLLQELSPSGEPHVTRYFLQPPQETWSPTEGRYSLSLSWDYEKSI